MKQFTIYNPFSGESMMDSCPADRLTAMVKYLAWMCGVVPSTLVIRETA